MSAFYVEIELTGPASPAAVRLKALVGTGASHSAVPEDVLADISITARTTRCLTEADGQRVERPLGQARMRIADTPDSEEFYVPIIFLPKGAVPLLGAAALETFGLVVDPQGERLLPSEALPY